MEIEFILFYWPLKIKIHFFFFSAAITPNIVTLSSLCLIVSNIMQPLTFNFLRSGQLKEIHYGDIIYSIVIGL